VAIDDDAQPKSLAVMYSQVRVRNLKSGRTHVQTVALPPDAEVLASRRALSSWAGPLLLGAREGDEVQWLNGGALERLRIEKVLCQPGAATPPVVSSVQTGHEDMRHIACRQQHRHAIQ
jgi:transcription elongation GreA/GreB family factor